MRRPLVLLATPLLSLLVVSGCGGPGVPASPTPAPPQEVTSRGLGIRLAALPADFKVVTNEDATLELEPSDPALEGRVVFSRGLRGDVNLVAAVNAHRQHIEGLPGGHYEGGQELVTPLGSAFYSRGRYLADNQEMEETVVVVLAPGADRILYLTYRYPAGVDSSVRVQQLLDLLGEVEPLPAQPAGGEGTE